MNKYYVPIAVSDHRDVFGNIFSESMYPLDITYEEDENGEINLESMSYCNVVKGPNAWCSLPVRRYDEYLNTTKGSVRIPPVVICSEYAGIPHKRVEFPTKYNIIKRDNGTCGYTGKKLSKDELSIDHIFQIGRASCRERV